MLLSLRTTQSAFFHLITSTLSAHVPHLISNNIMIMSDVRCTWQYIILLALKLPHGGPVDICCRLFAVLGVCQSHQLAHLVVRVHAREIPFMYHDQGHKNKYPRTYPSRSTQSCCFLLSGLSLQNLVAFFFSPNCFCTRIKIKKI